MIMQMITSKQSPAEVVRLFPKASDIFTLHHIDFCCGGKQSLKNVFTDQQLDEAAVLKELNDGYIAWKEAGDEAIDWMAKSYSEIIDEIMYNYHKKLKEELPLIDPLVTKIFHVHGVASPHLRRLYRLFQEFKMEMTEHSVKEEQEVFPLILQYEQQPSEALLQKIRIANGELEEEHDVTGDILKEMREITNDYTLPEHACDTYRVTYARLEQLEQETFAHVHLENNILFKKLAS